MPKKIVNRINRNLSRRLREARQEVGLSTRSVAKKLPSKFTVSHATIASYEKGDTVPPIDVLAALADLYVRPLNWFLENRETLSCFRYRNLPSRVRITECRQFEATTGKWADAYFNLAKYLKSHPVRDANMPELPSEDTPPDVLATTIRKQFLRLEDDEPVQNTVRVLESFSAWALEIKANFNIDCATARRGEEFIVVLNPDISNDRLRMIAAHELAHILYDGCKSNLVLTYEDIEKKAYAFALSLLLPMSQLRDAFNSKSFLKLLEYKEKFGISLAAMIYMAEKNKVINTSTARRLWAEMARRKWRQNKPGYVWRDRAIGFEMLLESAIQSHAITWNDAERVTGIRETELCERIVSVLETKKSQIEFENPPLLIFAPSDQHQNKE